MENPLTALWFSGNIFLVQFWCGFGAVLVQFWCVSFLYVHCTQDNYCELWKIRKYGPIMHCISSHVGNIELAVDQLGSAPFVVKS